MSDWIEVYKQLPEENQRVMLWIRDDDDCGLYGRDEAPDDAHIRIGSYRYGRLCHDGAGGNWHDAYSHWMSLPDPPAIAASKVTA